MPAEWCALGLAVYMALVQVSTPNPATRPRAGAAEVSLELLEFLGSFETPNGTWPELEATLDNSAPPEGMVQDPL